MTVGENQENKETEKPPIEAVIFDLDGLLVDSEPIWSRAYEKFLASKSLLDKPEISDKFRGMGIRELIGLMKEHFELQGDTDELVQEYRSVMYGLLLEPGNLHLMDGAEDLLKKLQHRYSLAIATSGHREEMARKVLKLLDTEHYFDQVISGDDVANGKPAPDVYLVSAEKLQFKPASCLVLEDSVNGVLSAKAAGMRVIGVNQEKDLRGQLLEAGADQVYDTLMQVSL